MKKPLNLVVIGTGMYVCGRGTEGYGTIMPAVYEWSKTSRIGDVYIAGATSRGVAAAKEKIAALGSCMNAKIKVKYLPCGMARNESAYLEALRKPEGPVCAIVAIPDHLHRKVSGDMIRAGLHTLVVKPLAPTAKEVRELVSLQDKSKVYCAVEYHKRFDEANLRLKDCVTQGVIGDPLYFVVEFSQKKSIPTKIFKKWVLSTNVFQYLGIHYVDIIYFITGAIPKRVMAIGQKSWLLSKGIDTYDSIQAVVEWEMPSGKRFSSHILTNWIDPESSTAMSNQRIKVIGTKGRFESDQKNRGITITTDEKGVEEPNPYFCAPYSVKGAVRYRGYGIDSVCQFLDDVVNVEDGKITIADLEKERPTFRRSIVPTAVLEAVNKSLKQGGAWMETKV